jgi:hypothetical protein
LIASIPFSEKRISPVAYFAGGEGSSCKMDKDVTDFPEPDSPTNATISPRFTINEMFFNAWVVADSAIKSTERFCMLRRGCND